ncbi:MAG: squalene/phytoene synthase family protein [Candidatus Omnitrophica bacterium]|nr:squalene/phytoene synthase family protein [Candidatus Omnitrophota bacterium]
MSYCSVAARLSRSNFYNALALLPKQRREAMFAVYSFCRAVDDAVDGCFEKGEKGEERKAHLELQRWRQEIADVYEGCPHHPIGQALKDAVQVYGIPQSLWHDIITGMEWDLVRKTYPDFETLEQYCYYVAGAVGLIAIRVFGCKNPQSEQFAKSLGTAFQLTNILRDIQWDAAAGRVYLPEEDLAQFGIAPSQLAQAQMPPALKELVMFERERAKRYFCRARSSVTPQDLKALTPAMRMAAVYETILDRMPQPLLKIHKMALALFPQRWLNCR